MKKKIFAVALVAALLVGGLVLASCDKSNCPGDADCYIAEGNYARTRFCSDDNCDVNYIYRSYWTAPSNTNCDC